MKTSAKYEAIGLDYLIREHDSKVQIIDLNSYPGYNIIKYPQMPQILERYLNQVFLEKKQVFFANFKDRNGFYPGKLLRVDAHTLRFRMAFIHREFSVTRVQGLDAGSYVITAIDGHNQKKNEIAKGWFEQGFLGRVIKLQKINHDSSDILANSETAFILTAETAENHQSLIIPFLSMNFGDLSDLCNFIREGDVLKFS